MFRNIGKRTLFFVSIFLTGLIGFVGSYLRTNFSKSDSLIVPKARADVAGSTCGWCGCPYTDGECTNYYSTCGTCFPVGTPISTPSGLKMIETLVIGDMVYGYDAKTGQTVSATVKATMKHSWEEGHVRSPLIIITHEKGSITITENHLVYRKNGKIGEFENFDRAGLLQVGDKLTTENGEESEITKIEKGPPYDFVYNLEVEGVHTFFADGIRVHNDGDGGCCGGGK